MGNWFQSLKSAAFFWRPRLDQSINFALKDIGDLDAPWRESLQDYDKKETDNFAKQQAITEAVQQFLSTVPMNERSYQLVEQIRDYVIDVYGVDPVDSSNVPLGKNDVNELEEQWNQPAAPTENPTIPTPSVNELEEQWKQNPYQKYSKFIRKNQ